MVKKRDRVLGGWARTLQESRDRADDRRARLDLMPLDLPAVSSTIQVVEGRDAAEGAVDALSAMRLRAIALDSEFKFRRAAVLLRKGHSWSDIRSQVPLALSVAAWAESLDDAAQAHIVRYVFDLRRPEVVDAIARLLRLRVPFVCHHAKSELMTLWTLGLDPDGWLLYDTFVAAAAIHLGIHHPRAGARLPDPDAEAERVQDAQAMRERVLSLVGQCHRYGLEHPFSASKDRLRERFLRLRAAEKLEGELVDYAAADAEYTLRVFVAQQADLMRLGLSAHLYQVEFPFVTANARIEWNGALVSPEGIKKLRESCRKAAAHHARRLRKLGMKSPGSATDFHRLVVRLGLAHLFTERTATDRLSTADDVLALLEDQHEAIHAFRHHQRLRRIAQERWLTGVLCGADGRHHPNHRQLGAHTGRNSCVDPNLAGIGKVFRPIVVAPPGRAIVELDFSQVEVGICAAEYRDEKLVSAYNSSDVYTFMARLFYWDELSHTERRMSLKALKHGRPDLRNNMKTFVLASLYGMQAEAIRLKFGLSLAEAQKQLERFLGLFPESRRMMDDSVAFGLVRGYAYTVSGLRRHLPPGKRVSSWTRNLLRNTPVQGSAAVVFKKAIVDLDAEFRGTSTLIILPVHDAAVLECDLRDVRRVAARAALIMEHAIRAYYPCLTGRVDANLRDVSCWNKDGQGDSLDLFLKDPSFTLG